MDRLNRTNGSFDSNKWILCYIQGGPLHIGSNNAEIQHPCNTIINNVIGPTYPTTNKTNTASNSTNKTTTPTSTVNDECWRTLIQCCYQFIALKPIVRLICQLVSKQSNLSGGKHTSGSL
jgi:hypothetical protein